ncbi:Phage tail fibers [hydrothermal vent metagenome]|uniref:Phage tail fibers n=1 Tax=hydrothermal vent metagenome TaxID=652676 RepID=A0A3B0UPR2_9ZZZZ
MAADYTQPLTVNKSVRFYDGQFLQDQDFIDEQKYQSARRNRHHRTLHVTGVAEGMTVYTPANSTFQVKVRAGVAIDAHGRQIVQPKISAPIDFADAAGASRWLYVAYDQKPVDKQASGQGVEGETRWLESPYFFAADKLLGVDDTYTGTDWNNYVVTDEGPPPPVLLAKLTIDSAGKVTIDETVRRYAGLRLPGKDSLAPVLRSDSAGNVGLWLVSDNDLSERLTVSPEGYLGVNSPAPTAALEIGSTLKATQNGQALVGLKIAPTFDEGGRSNVRKHGLIVTDGNVGIGTTTPIQTLDVNGRINVTNGVIQRGGEAITNTEDMGLYSRIDGHWMRFVTNAGPIKFFSDDSKGGTPNLTIQPDGNVGIGTTSPLQTLDVNGRINVTDGVIQRGGNAITNTGDLGLYSRVSGHWMRFVTNGGPIKFFSDDGKGETPNLTITPTNGNVGIGTTTPSEKLDVSGNALVSGNLTVDSNTLHVNSSNNRVGIGTTNPSEKLDVSGNALISGNVGIGTTSPKIHLAIGDNDTGLKQQGNGKLAIYTDNAERIRVDNFGNVGIGTTTPSEKLDVSGSALISGNVGIGTTSPRIHLAIGDNDTGLKQQGNGKLAIYTDNAERIRVDNFGNVGIGTTNPRQKLDVSGSALISGNLTVDSNTLHVDSSNNRVGIGTTSPDAKLEVAAPSSGVTLKLGRKAGKPTIKGLGDWLILDAPTDGKLSLNDWESGDVIIANGGGNVGIGTMNPQAKLHVDGEIRGKIWYSDEYVWAQGEGEVKMGHSDKCMAFLTHIQGYFKGKGEAVWVYIGEGGYWYLGGDSKQQSIRAKARCIGMP